MNEEEGNIFHRLMICGIEFLEWALDRESSCELCAEIDCEEGVCVNKSIGQGPLFAKEIQSSMMADSHVA